MVIILFQEVRTCGEMISFETQSSRSILELCPIIINMLSTRSVSYQNCISRPEGFPLKVHFI